MDVGRSGTIQKGMASTVAIIPLTASDFGECKRPEVESDEYHTYNLVWRF